MAVAAPAPGEAAGGSGGEGAALLFLPVPIGIVPKGPPLFPGAERGRELGIEVWASGSCWGGWRGLEDGGAARVEGRFLETCDVAGRPVLAGFGPLGSLAGDCCGCC
mmetsp:Transcript_10718/g.13489  ORF Transcript_10718/g.13489 Transcript_10718/m.13489 type:complete len:107 (-) Transcript_10718:1247-1567(-)